MGFPGKFYLSLWLVILTGNLAMSASAYAEDCEAKYHDLTDEQRERFDIAYDEWKPAAPGVPAHAFLVGCQGCAGARYDANGNHVNSLEMKKIPTSWVMRVPKNCADRTLVFVPPGMATATQVFTQFAGLIGPLMNEGYAIAVTHHAGPGFPGFTPYESFMKPPFHTHDYRNGYLGTSHLLRDLLSEVFVAPAGYYAFSTSRGTSIGNALLADEPGAPFDGFVLGTGGNGILTTIMDRIASYLAEPNRVPLTGLTPMETTAQAKLDNLIGPIGISTVDPQYREAVLAEPTVDAQLALALAYDVTKRPKAARRAWENMELGADLQRPTIIFHGLRDRTVFPGGQLEFVERIVDAGKSELVRLYLVRNMSHGGPFDPPPPPQGFFLDAVHALDAWVQSGTEPGALNAGQFGFQPSCSSDSRPFAEDPLGCFCSVMGGVDFNGELIAECH